MPLTTAVERRSSGTAAAALEPTAEAEFRERLAALEARTAGVPCPAPCVGTKTVPAMEQDPDDDSSPFECNICLELARDPVVTYCGHLYCWPCIYRWLQVAGTGKSCPVCKTAVDKDRVVPIYGRGADGDEGTVAMDESNKIPKRPAGKPPQLSLTSMIFGAGFSHASFMNSIFILEEEINAPEHQHQALLARLLLMLGSFVIMFLLLI